MILRHRLHCIIVKAKRREGPSGAGSSSSSYRPASPAKWEDGHCASEKVRKGGARHLEVKPAISVLVL